MLICIPDVLEARQVAYFRDVMSQTMWKTAAGPPARNPAW